MKLISKFKDYYDNVLNTLLREEDKLFYKREEELINDKFDYFDKLNKVYDFKRSEKFIKNHKTKETINIYAYNLVFCGNLYNFTLFHIQSSFSETFKIAKNFDEYKKLAEEHIENFKFDTKYYWNENNNRFYHNTEKSVRNFFDIKIENISAISNELKSYSFLYFTNNRINGKNIYLNNPKLEYLHFEKIKDPYTAAQEVSQYINGVLSCVCTPEVKFTDKDILMAKGFDPKISFRKEKNSK
jgi:hypothetical protein